MDAPDALGTYSEAATPSPLQSTPRDVTPGNIRIVAKIAREKQAGSRRRDHQNVRVGLPEVAAAFAQLWGESHLAAPAERSARHVVR